MKTRIISGAVGIVLLAGILYFGGIYPLVFVSAIAALSAIATFEIVSAVGLRKNYLILLSSIVFAAGLPSLTYYSNLEYSVPAVFLLVLLYFFAAVVMHKKVPFSNAVTSLGMVLFVSWSFCTLPQFFKGSNGWESIIMLLIWTWGSDSGAYFVGSFLGKHKLIPEVSPKKTVEGLIGGVVTSTVLTVAFLAILNVSTVTGIMYLIIGIIAAIASLVSVLGDLSFSQLKRSYGIKDFGNIMPGHGGVLDRFDSVLFVAPLLYLLTMIIF